MYKINSKKVIVTGGASGIGQAKVDLFLKCGAKVIIFDNKQDMLDIMLATRPTLYAAINVDVSDYHALLNAFNTIDTLWNDIDILINNAGISIRHDNFYDISIEDWYKVIETNLSSVFYMSKIIFKYMREGSSILNISSINALAAFPHYADYNVSKTGIIALTKTMAIELAAKKIRVNALCPGAVITPMQLKEYTDEMFKKVNQNIPLSRHAKPEEIANFCFSFIGRSSFYNWSLLYH
ncbi:MAG: 2-(S)-hydroxypropyl-CoM dehydrogenase [Burkholderiales bacterium]|jgi:NAD(P)-dependent dehydrogenase (short-subunit alcohol dehydrogenase family)|nr:2-(S)-hydroxypropyl-CoM dehydrogenase [Burkholderiales bacterium]